MSTHKFKLPSGFQCEVSPMLGKHQKMLTSKEGGNLAEKMNAVLRDVIVSVDGEAVNEAFVNKMLAADRKAVLVEVRHFSLGFPETFDFDYTYAGEFTTTEEQEGSEPKVIHHKEFKERLSIPTPKFPVKPYPEWKDAEGKPVTVSKYADIPREVYLELPVSKKKIRWSLADGAAEGRLLSMKDRSSHTPLEMRNPCYAHQGPNEVTWVRVTLDTLPIADIEAIRKSISENEAEVDTVVILEHPYKDQVDEQYKFPRVDLVQEVAFFFPSQAL